MTDPAARIEKKFGDLHPAEQFVDGRGHPYIKIFELINQDEQHYNAIDLKFGRAVHFLDSHHITVSR